MAKTLLEFFYILAGLVSVITGIYAFTDKGHTKKIGTGLFWIIFGVIFIFGPYIPPVVVGWLLLFMGVLTLTKNVAAGTQANAEESYREAKSEKIGNTLFFPAVSMGVITFAVAQFTKLGGLVGLGIGALAALILTLAVTKENPKYITYDSSRLLQQMGAAVILPQLLGALGALFTKAGVGNVLAEMLAGIVPEGSILAGVIIYCVAMALFTMIMGNAFAAFAVITAGVGMPFLIKHGADPVIVGALGLTAGFCGTLMTPMAANFNVVPAAVLEMKDKNAIIKSQLPYALILLLTHMILMYVLI